MCFCLEVVEAVEDVKSIFEYNKIFYLLSLYFILED